MCSDLMRECKYSFILANGTNSYLVKSWLIAYLSALGGWLCRQSRILEAQSGRQRRFLASGWFLESSLGTDQNIVIYI